MASVSMVSCATASASEALNASTARATNEIRHAGTQPPVVPDGFAKWCDEKLAGWQAEIAAVAKAPAPEPSAVLDPDTSLLDGDALRAAAKALAAILPPLPEDATPLRRQRHARLCDDLKRIEQLAGRLRAMPPAQQGLEVRDAYARAARSARQLAHNLEGSRWRRWKAEPTLATAYAGVAALLGALKDRHRTAAAVHIAQRDAEREAQRLSEAGWRQGRAGDAMVNGSGASAAHMGAPLLGGGARWQDWRFNDDDSKMYYVEQICAFFEGGLGGQLDELKAKLAGKVASQFGTTVLMSLDQVALARLVLNHHANRASFKADGPRARDALARLDRVAALAQKLLGKHYTGTPAAPCLGDARLAKGVNAGKLECIAQAIDATQGKGSTAFADWLSGAYPAPAQTLRTRLERGQPLPQDPVQSAVGCSMVYRAKSLGQHQTVGSAEATAGIGTAAEGDVEIGGSVAASHGPLHFFFALPRAAHELLDPAHTRDLRQTLAMHAALEREIGTRPVMAAYRRVADALHDETPPSAAQGAWPADGDEALGQEQDVPAGFHAAIKAPGAAGLRAVQRAGETLEQAALELVDGADLLLARPSRHWPKELEQALEARREQAYRTLVREVFQGDAPCTLAEALLKPEDFIATCHDALSLALARAQTERWLLAHALVPADAKPTGEVASALQGADAACGRARQLLDSGHLGLTRRRLTQEASVQAHATYQRHETALKATLNLQPSSPEAGLEDAMGTELPQHFQMRTSAGRLAFSVEARWQVADYQINPSRLGQFLQLTFRAEGGLPLVGDAVREAVLHALRLHFPGARREVLQDTAAGLVPQLQGLALDMTAGASVVVKLRQPPGVDAWDLQFVRGFETRTSGIDVSKQAATASGWMNFGLQSGTSTQTCVFAAFGPCLGNLGMQMVTLNKVLAGLDDGRTLAECFDAHPEAKDMYFALPGTVPTVIQRFLDRERDDGRIPGQAAARPLPNEFYRFYDEPPFARIAQTGPQLQRLKPGPSSPTTAAPPVSAVEMLEGVDWEQAKQTIALLRTPEERLAWYDGEGRRVFDTFLAVMRELDAHNAAFIAHGGKGHHGFVMSVKGT